MSRLSDAAWWYWLATVILLTGCLSGCTTCFYLAVVLCVVQATHFARRRRSMPRFPSRYASPTLDKTSEFFTGSGVRNRCFC
jgi:hypothetical protein